MVLDPGTHQERERRARKADQDSTRRSLSKQDKALADRLKNVLLGLDEAGDPTRSVAITAQGHYRRPDSSADEGASTRWARELHRKVHRVVKPLLDEYELRVRDEWKPPLKLEKVRCRNRKCKVERIPRFVGPGSSIELVRCPTCDHALSAL